MFQRRVAASMGIPKHMYRSLHISSARQANRMLPPLVPVSALRTSEGGALGGGGAVGGVSLQLPGESGALLTSELVGTWLASYAEMVASGAFGRMCVLPCVQTKWTMWTLSSGRCAEVMNVL